MRNPLSLEGLIAWLEKQPADGEYEYWAYDCLIGQYLKQSGLPFETLGASGFRTIDGQVHDFPPSFDDVAWRDPRTYGAALARARQLASEPSP